MAAGGLRAEVLRPFTRKTKKFNCELCSLSYSRKQYKILYDSKKLAYFFLYTLPHQDDPSLLCHDCFTRILMGICADAGLPQIKVLCKDGRKKFILDVEFNPDISLDFDDLNLD